jgi:hypothetical protein
MLYSQFKFMQLDLDQYPTTDGSARNNFYPYTIRDIYLGRYFERFFFSELLRGLLNSNTGDEPKAIKFELSETLLRVWPNEDRTIQAFIDSWERSQKWGKNNTLVNRETLRNYLRDCRGITSTFGFTNLIEIILTKNREAFFDPESLRELDSQSHISYEFIELKHITGNIFEYTPCYHTWSKKLDKKIHDLNLSRSNFYSNMDSSFDSTDDQDFVDFANEAYEISAEQDFSLIGLEGVSEAEENEQDTLRGRQIRGVNLF